jgi:hypothetical protein
MFLKLRSIPRQLRCARVSDPAQHADRRSPAPARAVAVGWAPPTITRLPYHSASSAYLTTRQKRRPLVSQFTPFCASTSDHNPLIVDVRIR